MTIRPGDDTAAGQAARGHLRASHADREQVVGTLQAAFVQGMLTKDELDARVGQALASRTYAQLAALTADLPAGLTAVEQPWPWAARARGGRPAPRTGRWVTVASVLYACVWAYLLLLSPHGGDNHSAPGLIFGGFGVYLIVWIYHLGEMSISRREKRSGGQPPRRPAAGAGGQASRRLPSAGPDRELPPAGHDPRHTAEAEQGRGPRSPLPPRRGHPLRRRYVIS